MLKSDLVSGVWERHPDLLKSDVEALVRLMFGCMGEALKRGETIEIRGLGRFSITDRAPRLVRNPRTGDTRTQERRKVVHFRAGKDILDRING
jgi:integration host factor subunit beta